MAKALGRRLADTSAWHAARRPSAARSWEDALAADEVVLCAQVRLEILFSARSARDYEELAEELSALPHAACDEEVFARALDVQRKLSRVGALHHRSVNIADLIIAASAEKANLPVWHYDEDYERIAAVTGQPTAWIVRRGTL
jgi:hypothetical protein